MNKEENTLRAFTEKGVELNTPDTTHKVEIVVDRPQNSACCIKPLATVKQTKYKPKQKVKIQRKIFFKILSKMVFISCIQLEKAIPMHCYLGA